MSNLENNQKVSYVVFFAALIVVLLTLTPVIFPALFSSVFGMYAENLDAFELGYQAIFLIVSNVVIFGFGIAYYKKKINAENLENTEKVANSIVTLPMFPQMTQEQLDYMINMVEEATKKCQQ